MVQVERALAARTDLHARFDDMHLLLTRLIIRHCYLQFSICHNKFIEVIAIDRQQITVSDSKEYCSVVGVKKIYPQRVSDFFTRRLRISKQNATRLLYLQT